MIIKKNKLFVCFIYLITVLASVFLIMSENSFAAGSGAWIPEGSASGTAGGGGGGGSSSCRGDNGKYIVDCTGVSWIHYKYVGGASHSGQDILFTPGSTNPSISGECAYEGRGFWHFGVNAQGFNYGGYADFGRLKGYSDAVNVYLGSSGKWGHRLTYTMGFWRNNNWMDYKTHGSSYNHRLYKKINGTYVLMYQADGYASDPETNGKSAVLRDYKTAYKRKTGKDYTGTKLPDSAYAFCSWSGDDVTLSAIGKIDGDTDTVVWQTSDLGPGASQTVDVGEDATVIVPARLAKGAKVYEFVYWDSSCPENGRDGRRCTKKAENNRVAAYYKERPSLPCGGTCGSTLKLELNHDGKTEASTAIVSGIDDVSKRITKTPFMEEFEAGTSKYYGKVYVKPGEVSIKGSFKPEYQSYREEKPEKFSIIDYAVFGSSSEAYRAKSGDDYYSEGWNNNNNLNITSDDITIEQYVKNFYNKSFFSPKYDTNSKGKQWNNAFNIAVKDNTETEVDCHLVQGTIGDNSEFYNTISYSFKVGHRFSMQSRTNDFRNDNETSYCVNDDHITPRVIKFDYDSVYNERATIDNSRTRTARIEAYVPYNFVNGVSIKNNNGDEVVFAGETIDKIEYTVTSYTRHNSKVNPEDSNDKYLTNVPEAKVRFRYRYNGSNEYINIGSEESIGSIGASSDVGISTADITKDGRKNISIPVPDFSAGDRICISLSVWPRDSLSDTTWEWNDIENKVGWSDWSNEKCYIIAKKPSFQIWGGSLYSNGNISLPIATKKIKDEDITRTFGSWVELGLTSEGTVEGLASGAGTASGINIRSFCNISTLSIPNNNCGFNYVGRTSSGDRVENRSNLVEMYDGGIDENNIDIGPETISRGTLSVTKTKGTVTIKKNIEYAKENYTTLQEIPKRIIYAKNININCEVTRIDAVLMAEEDINTCADGGDDNDQKRSIQLIINGSTISDKLILGRTYGAATGANSAIPAEIINYDTSLYLWARKNDASRGSSKFINVSTSELAPRY